MNQFNVKVKDIVRKARAQRLTVFPEYSWFHWDGHKVGLPFGATWVIWKPALEHAARLQQRYQRYVHYCNEVLPQWTVVKTYSFADNSTEVDEVCKCGQHKRRRMTTAPHGDLCF
jgi:hypothetical protein